MGDSLSLPLRERELKFVSPVLLTIIIESLPLRERGLKLQRQAALVSNTRRSLYGSVD